MPTNAELARIFTEIGEILDYQGADPFRVRAYFTAARSIELWPEPVANIALTGGEKGLREIPGVGEAIAVKLIEIARTGRLRLHDRLTKQVPAVVLALERIPGVGPKTAKQLYVRLKPTSVTDLAKTLRGMVRRNDYRRLPGLGEKTVENILAGMTLRRQLDERLPLGVALPIAERFRSHLEADTRVQRVDLAGSLRRSREDVGDVDLVAATNAPRAMIDRFVKTPGVTRVINQGRTKATVVANDRATVDLELLPRESYGSLLQHLTGSKDHNVAFRILAERNGLSFSEHGFRVTNARRPIASRAIKRAKREHRYETADRLIRCHTEEQVYEVLGLDWIPPELRENRGELELAGTHQLPMLVEETNLKGDLHTHTAASRDGHDESERVIERAIRLGHQYLAITDHTAGIGVAGKLSERAFFRHAERLRRLNDRYQEIEVLAGCEANIRPDGSLDVSRTLLESLDVVVASIHSSFRQPSDVMTSRILRAIEQPAVTVLAHPTTRRIGERGEIAADWPTIFAAAARTNTALEINAALERLDLDSAKVRLAKAAGCRFLINSDSHRAGELGAVRFGVAVARRGWCEPRDILNTLPRAKFLAWLKGRKETRSTF